MQMETIQSKQPAVSIIMPAYRVSHYIPEALKSVFAQTFTDYELIVVNDGSPDTEQLEEALAPYRDRIIYIKQENRGCAAARNTAIRASSGKFIALLDGDDEWRPDYLSVQIANLEADPTLDMLYPDALIFGETKEAGKRFMQCFPSKGEVTLESLIRAKCNVMICATIRRDAIVRAGLFDEDLGSSEDFDLWLRILEQGGRIGYHRIILARYRRRPESLSANPIGMYRHVVMVLDRAEARGRLDPEALEALREERERYRAMLRLYQGKNAFFAGDIDAAIEDLRHANRFFRSFKLVAAMFLLRIAPNLLLQVYNLRQRLLVGNAREI